MSGFPVEIDVEEGENDAGENTFDDDDVDSGFFFGQCCARCNNSGSHEDMLN